MGRVLPQVHMSISKHGSGWIQWPSLLLAVVLLAACTPPGPRALLSGERLIREGQYEQAIAQLKVATELLPNNAQAFNHLGLAYHGARIPDKAVEAYMKAILLDRNLAPARFNLGCLLLEQNRYAAAVSELTTFVMLSPQSAEGWTKLGLAQLNMGSLGPAEQSLKNALQINHRSPEALNGLGLVQLRRNRPVDALSYFGLVLQQQTNYAPAVLNEAVVYHQYLKNRAMALQRYQDYLSLNPQGTDLTAVREMVRALETEGTPSGKPVITNVSPLFANVVTQHVAGVVAKTNPVPAPASNAMVNVAPVPAKTTNVVVPPPAKVEPAIKTPVLPVAMAATRPEAPTAIPTTPVKIEPKPEVKPVVKSEPPTETKAPAKIVEKAVPAPAKTTVAEAKQPDAPKTVVTPPPSPVISLPEQPADQAHAQAKTVVTVVAPAPSEITTIAVPSPSTTQGGGTSAQSGSATTTTATTRVTSDQPAASQEKHGFWERLNPVGWFQSKPVIKNVTPLDGGVASSTIVKKAAPAARTVSVPAAAPVAMDEPAVRSTPMTVKTPLPEKPMPARYPYRNPPKPAAGDARTAQKYLAEGTIKYRDGYWREAIQAFEKSRAADPSMFEARYNLGLCYFHENRLSESLLEFETSLAITPDSFYARYNLALAMEKANYPKDAANELEKLVEKAPNDTRLLLMLGNIYARELYQTQSARNYYGRLLELEPTHPQAVAIRRWLAENS